MGYLYAVITSLLYTAYTIPRKLSKSSVTHYSFFQGIGFFSGAAIVFLSRLLIPGVEAESLLNPLLLLSALSGVCWFTGCAFFFMAIDTMGLTGSNQWKNLQGVFGALFNLIFLAEYRQTNVLLIALACLSILVSALFLTIPAHDGARSNKKGILYALIAALLFGFNSMLLKNGTNHGLVWSQQLIMTLSVLISSSVQLVIKEKRLSAAGGILERDNLLAVLGGVIFYTGLAFSIKAYELLPGSIAYTIIQLNAVWTVFAGIWIFREVNFRSNVIRILSGLLFALAGVFLLMKA